MPMTIYFLHVLFAFAAIALLVVPGLMLEMVAHTRDVGLIRRMFALGSFHGRIGGPLALLTAIVAYVAFVIVMALGIGYHTRREVRIASLARASPDNAPSPELAAAIDDRLATP